MKMPAQGIRARVLSYPTARQPHRAKKVHRMSINARGVKMGILKQVQELARWEFITITALR